MNSRYDGIISVFGRKFMERMTSQRYFMVGAGAIGCELLKNFTLMGLGAGPQGKVGSSKTSSISIDIVLNPFFFLH